MTVSRAVTASDPVQAIRLQMYRYARPNRSQPAPLIADQNGGSERLLQ